MKIKRVLKVLIVLFIIILLIIIIRFVFFLFNSHIQFLGPENENNYFYMDHFSNDNFRMYLIFPNVYHTLGNKISLETMDQKPNLVLCYLVSYPSENDITFKITKMKLLITDLKNNKVIDVNEIYLNDEKLTTDKNQVANHQINFENIGYHDGYVVEYYYNDFTYTTKEIRLNFDLLLEQGNKSFSYSKEYILKKTWEGFGFNICLD
jgi:hypothetical protein